MLCTAKCQAGGHMADLAMSHPRPMGGGQPVAGGGTADPLSVLGAGAEVDYLEQFGASSVSTQHRRSPADQGQALHPCSAHPAPRPWPTWLRPQRHLLCAGPPKGRAGRQAGDTADPASSLSV